MKFTIPLRIAASRNFRYREMGLWEGVPRFCLCSGRRLTFLNPAKEESPTIQPEIDAWPL
jgi:hypothetical protein